MENKKIIKFICFLFIFLCGLKYDIVSAKYYDLYDTIKNNAVLDNQSSEFVSLETGISFKEVSSDTNGKGIYIIANTKNDTYPILYYRGNVSNNYVAYAGYCWQIIRTTDKGGIKLLYSGPINENNTCNVDASELIIGKSQFGSSSNGEYIGYMYSLEGEEVNSNDSLVKTVVDEWFKNNLLNYEEELEDTIFCNDRSIDQSGRVLSYSRLIDGNPTLVCNSKDDSFTVDSKNGNGKLTYPVGIITADEVLYAGGYLEVASTDYYLNIGISYWSMTPYSANKLFYPNSKGVLNRNSITYNTGVRPVIALKNGTIYTEGVGTKDNPYIISKKYEYNVMYDNEVIKSDYFLENDEVLISIPYYKDMIFKEVRFYDDNDNEIELDHEKTSDDGYKIKMINKNVNIKLIYEEIPKPIKYNYVVMYNEQEISNGSYEQDKDIILDIPVYDGMVFKNFIIIGEDSNKLNFSFDKITDTNYIIKSLNKNITINLIYEEIDEQVEFKYNIIYKDKIIDSKTFMDSSDINVSVPKYDNKKFVGFEFYDEENNKISLEYESVDDNTYKLLKVEQNINVVLIYDDLIEDVVENPNTLGIKSIVIVLFIISFVYVYILIRYRKLFIKI